MLKQLIHLSLAGSLLLTACEVPAELEESTEVQWSTYTSEKYGFSVNFPSTWSVEEDFHERPYIFFTSQERAEAADGIEGDQMVRIDAQIKIYEGTEDLPNNNEGLSFESWLETEDNYFDGHVTETTVDEEIAYKIDSIDSFDGSENVFTMVEHNGKIYELNFNAPNAEYYTEEREHMLDSFQFLSSTNETSSSSCDEEACFMENFKTCEFATISSDLGFAAVAYEILGVTTEGCDVQMVYTKNPNSAWVDQPIVCTLDMDADFLPAWQKEFEAAVEGKGNCTGSLVEILQN